MAGKEQSTLESLLAEGRATPSAGDPRKLPPPISVPPGTPDGQALLDDLRTERI